MSVDLTAFRASGVGVGGRLGLGEYLITLIPAICNHNDAYLHIPFVI